MLASDNLELFGEQTCKASACTYHFFLLFCFCSIQQHYPAYSATVRLSKRWVAAQLMADHVTDECIELLVASLFLSPGPFTPPR